MIRSMTILLVGLLLVSGGTGAATKNGFELERSLVKPAEIRRGGPPKDGIPAIVRPRFVTADAVDFLAPQDRVLGLVLNGVPRAYAVKILDWHEVVNYSTQASNRGVTYVSLC